MKGLILPAVFFVSAVLLPALADDAPFLGTDPASVMATGEMSVQQWMVFGHGHCKESFSSLETQSEFDYGITDRLQLNLSVLYDWSRTHPQSDSAQMTSLAGFQGEAIWSVLATDKSPIGVAISVNPAVNPALRRIAFRLLFTKYVSRFENVLNINFENNWDKDTFGHWQASSAVVFHYGIAHSIKNWSVGVEFGNEFAFTSLLTDPHLDSAANTFYAGPTLQYDFGTGTVGIGVQTQLPVSSGPHVDNGYTADADRWRVAFRIARSL